MFGRSFTPITEGKHSKNGVLALQNRSPDTRTGHRSLGFSYHTVNRYLDFLEGAYLVRRLAPWSGRIAKRLVRSPKVYLRDSGLLHALIGIAGREAP